MRFAELSRHITRMCVLHTNNSGKTARGKSSVTKKITKAKLIFCKNTPKIISRETVRCLWLLFTRFHFRLELQRDFRDPRPKGG